MERKEAHKTFRGNLRDFDSTQYINDDSQQMIKVFYKGKSNKRAQERFNGESDYTDFILHKKFIDTPQAINVIGKKIWRRSKDFYVAGNKVSSSNRNLQPF